MRSFRCYSIAETGKATDSIVVKSRTPEEAAEEAMERFAGRPYISVEVWDGAHRELTTRNAHIPSNIENRLHAAAAVTHQHTKGRGAEFMSMSLQSGQDNMAELESQARKKSG
jgi:hypothetical protein